MTSKSRSLEQKIKSHEARVGVIGLGYVGLPLATEFARAGFSTTGFEVDRRKVKNILAGRSYISDVPTNDLKTQVRRKKLTASTNFSRLQAMDVIIICVPTPLNKTKDPDISFIDAAAQRVATTLRSGQLIILESTTYPGTTREHVLPMLNKRGLHVGKDFYLAFSPERIDPANKQYKLRNTPKVTGGITPRCGELAALLYQQVVQKVVTVSSAEAAELTKLLENTFRAVNIGLVNELMLICDKLGLNVWEIVEAASTKPYGFMPFYPGPGLGGHCIPVDPHYLSWKMKALNFSARFIELAGEVNSHMPDFVVQKIARILNNQKKSVKSAQLLILGAAYKPDVSDTRESPSLDVMQLLLDMGAKVSYHDPYVPVLRIGTRTFKSRPYSAEVLRSADAVVIATAHSVFDPRQILSHARLVIDARNLCRGIRAPNLIRL